MCGIVGVVCSYNKNNNNKNNNKNIIKYIVDGLEQLQNRGYDSAGICVISNHNSFVVDKVASNQTNNAIELLKKSQKFIYNENLGNENICVGIGHTRWATHGPKTTINAHPHMDCYDSFSIVHNGIIDNYAPIKQDLIDKGYWFKSDTDTEVIANLLSYEFRKLFCINNSCVNNLTLTNHEMIKIAIRNTMQQLHGTFALCILSVHDPYRLYCVRRGSPLLIGINEKEGLAIVTSEQSGFNETMKSYYVLDNDDLCSIFYNSSNSLIVFETEKNYTSIILNNTDNTKTLQMTELLPKYDHWMQREIYEQSESIPRATNNGGRILDNTRVKLGGFYRCVDQLQNLQHLILLGCGTSYHAGLVATHYFKDLCVFQTVSIYDGAEFSMSDLPKISQYDTIGCILLSQSGETRDLHNCIRMLKSDKKTKKICLIGVINVPDSLIAREVDCGVYLNAGREVAVASTKSFTSQLVVLQLIAIWFAQIRNVGYSKRKTYIQGLMKLQETKQETKQNIEKVLKSSEELCERHEFLEMFQKFPSCFLLGKGTCEGIAREGALKIKEIAYLHAEGYSSSALKHGPFALLEPGFPVIIIAFESFTDHNTTCIAGKNNDFTKSINALEEIKSRGACVFFITNSKHIPEKADYCLQISCSKNEFDILSIIPLQILSYRLSLAKGLNPDFPRNLAKVVTVE